MEIEIGGEELHGEEKILNLNIEVGLSLMLIIILLWFLFHLLA